MCHPPSLTNRPPASENTKISKCWVPWIHKFPVGSFTAQTKGHVWPCPHVLTLGMSPHPVLGGAAGRTSDLYGKDSADLLNVSYPQTNPFHLPAQVTKEVIEQQQLVIRLFSTPFLNAALEKEEKKAKRRKACYSKEPNWGKIQKHRNVEAAIVPFEIQEGSSWSGNICCDFIFIHKNKNIHICI